MGAALMALYGMLILVLSGWVLCVFGFTAVLTLCIAWLDSSGDFSFHAVVSDWVFLCIRSNLTLFGCAVSLYAWHLKKTGRWAAMCLSGWSEMQLMKCVFTLGLGLAVVEASLYGWFISPDQPAMAWVEWNGGFVRLRDGAFVLDGVWQNPLSEVKLKQLNSLQHVLNLSFSELSGIEHNIATIEFHRRLASIFMLPLTALWLMSGPHFSRRIFIFALLWLLMTTLGVALSLSGLLPAALGPWLGASTLLLGWLSLFRTKHSGVIDF